jgi:hypothetical protein
MSNKNAFHEDDTRIHPVGQKKKWKNYKKVQSGFKEQYRRNWNKHADKISSGRIKNETLKILIKRRKMFGNTSQMMEGLSFFSPV